MTETTQSLIDKSTNFCYNQHGTTAHPLPDFRKERFFSMSFDGVLFLSDNIVAFADRKSTCIYNGEKRADKEVDGITKVFSNNKFAIAFTGTNAVHIREKRDINTWYIQDWCKNHISEFNTPQEMCEELLDYIQDYTLNDYDEINIIAGYRKKDGRPIGYEAKIQNGNIFATYHYPHDLPFYIVSGDNLFRAEFTANSNPYMTSSESELMIALQALWKHSDYGDNYNPVGNEWNIRKI